MAFFSQAELARETVLRAYPLPQTHTKKKNDNLETQVHALVVSLLYSRKQLVIFITIFKRLKTHLKLKF